MIKSKFISNLHVCELALRSKAADAASARATYHTPAKGTVNSWTTDFSYKHTEKIASRITWST